MSLLACAVLTAQLTAPGPNAPDTSRIQHALDLCSPGRAVVLSAAGGRAAFVSAALILPRGVILYVDRGVKLYASPGVEKPFIFSYQAAFSGVAGPGTIDGRGVAQELITSYESQEFSIRDVTLRGAASIHAAIYKTTGPKIEHVQIQGEQDSTGILLSNALNAVVDNARIEVPGDALVLQASILGPSTDVRVSRLRIVGGRGIAIGDTAYGPVRNATFDDISIEKASAGFLFRGETRGIRASCLRGLAQQVTGGAFESTAPCGASAPDGDRQPTPVDRTAPATAGTFIQQAIDALPPTGGEVRLKPGIYREVVTIRKPHVHLYGADPDPSKTVIVYNHGPAYGGTFASATVFVEAPDVTLDHLTIANDLGPGKGQGVALAVTADRAVFRHLRLLGAQDTLFAASRYCYGDYGPCVAARQYFADCYIEGNTDFIFGDSQAVFERCELHGIATGSVMYTAQSRHTAEQRDSGYVFDHCRLTGDPRAADISLGRPWRPYATVVFLNTQIDAPVIPAGWTEWVRFGKPSLPTVYYAEYRSTGPGARPGERDPHSHQLTDAEAARWSPRRFLAGADNWNPGF